MAIVQIDQFQSRFLSWHQCHCDRPGCNARGPIKASAEAALDASFRYGWHQVGGELACSACVARLAEIGAAVVGAGGPFRWPSQQKAEGE